MFLCDEQIAELMPGNEEEIKGCTLRLHASKIYDPNVKNNVKDFEAITLGGYEYPRHLTFITKEIVTLDKKTIGLVFGKQRLATRDKLLVFPGIVNPGFSYHLLIQVTSLGSSTVIRKGEEIASVVFSSLESETKKAIDMNKWCEELGLKPLIK